jgi:hypothetical protein
MSPKVISPWCLSVTLKSPDGRFAASIDDAGEVGMGAPNAGELVISNGMRLDACNPSMVWSDDSRFLAVPQWTNERKQRLVVISVDQRILKTLGGLFDVLELHDFSQGKIKLIDLGNRPPEPIEFDTKVLSW